MNDTKVSKCCKANMLVAGEDEGTRIYQCQKCLKPTDPFTPAPKSEELTEQQIIDGINCLKSMEPLSTREELKHKLFGIVAKLDNGSHSANQLQGIDESFTKLIDNVLSQSREDTLAEVRERLPKEIEKKINSAGGIGGTKHLNGMIDDILSTLTNLKEEKI